MNENEQEMDDSTNDTEITENPDTPEEEIEEEATAEPSEEEVDVEALKKENETLKAQKEHWREKAAKPKESAPQPVHEGVSLKDSMALINAKVHEDDVDDIIEYAKFKKISISEALKSGVIKATLEEKTEHRATADATNTGKSRGSTGRLTGEALLKKTQKTGEIPESDEELEKLLDARYDK
jgi:hypothetical protein